MRRDLHLTDEEFINLLKEYISKRGIKAMFENANLEKDETVTIKGEKTMSNLIMLTGMQGKKFLVNKTFITGTSFFKHNSKEYTLLETKNNTSLIAEETPSEIFELIEKSEAKEKAPIINFIKLTEVEYNKDLYIKINNVSAITPQTANTTAIKVDGDWVFVFETIEEILAKIEEITK